jgi:translocator protein
MDKAMAVVVSIGSVVAASMLGGSYGSPRPRAIAWQTGLRKPPSTATGNAVGVAWCALDGLLGLTGYRLLTRPRSAARTVALACWVGSVAGLAGFPASFFKRRDVTGGAAASSALLAAAAATTASASNVDRVATLASTPLVLWTGFATLLSEELWRRNQPDRPARY